MNIFPGVHTGWLVRQCNIPQSITGHNDDSIVYGLIPWRNRSSKGADKAGKG